MAATIFRLGWTNPLTDAFGAHPTLGAVLDLNDGLTFTLATPDGVALPPPPRSVVAAGNPRTIGERVTRAIYRHNREVVARVLVGPMASYADLATTIRTLVAWLAAPPAVPLTIQFQPPGAAAPVYLDVVAAAHDLPTDESQWLRLQIEPAEIVFLVRPGLRGDRVTLSNLVPNPGFEAPSAPGVAVFADPLTTTNAYSVVSGAAPSLSPALTYADVVLAAANGGTNLLRYYRLDETSGTAAYDIGGTAQTGTSHGSPIQGVAGALSGDSDTCYTFASASSQYVSLPTSGLSTGNGAFSIAAWIKFATNPSANAVIAAFGSDATKSRAMLYLTPSGTLALDVYGTGTGTGAALATGIWHFVVGTYDGTTLRAYVDGAAYGGSATPGTLSLGSGYATIGSDNGTQWYWNGQLDEVCLYSQALSAAQIATLYAAGSSGASGTVASAMGVPAGATVAFGSPAWGAIQTWQVRFRYVSGLTAAFSLHRTDGNNSLYASVSSGAGLGLYHRVGGTLNTLATSGLTLTHEAWYWLRCTQFPSPPGDPPYVQATLNCDQGGQMGAQLAQVGAGAYDAVTALAGQAALSATGAALAIGGTGNNGVAGAGQQVALFGPGGWVFSGGSGTGVASGAWEQNSATTLPRNSSATSTPNGGPVVSYGAARIDMPPAGTVNAAQWSLHASGAPVAGSSLMAVAAGQTLGWALWARSSGLSAAAQIQVVIAELDGSGNVLRSSAAATQTGNLAAWTPLSGNYTTGAGCVYVDLWLRVSDTSAPGASAGATVWLDNVQVWNQTATGQTSMPYCELRFPQSPAQLVVSGLLGDLPAPAYLACGTYLASWPAGSSLSFAVGRGANSSPTARLVLPSNGYFGAGGSPLATAALDPAGYCGYSVAATANPSWSPRPFSLSPADAPGVYHLFQRFQSAQATANLANVQCRANVLQRTQPWYGSLSYADELWDSYGPYSAPLSASNTWTVVDAGQVALPPAPLGALTDPAQNYLSPHAQWVDNTAGGSLCRASWAALVPVDGSLLVGALNNPSNAPYAVTAQWLWAYFDGLLANGGGASDGPAWGYSVEAAPAPNPAHAGGGPGTQTTGSINLNSGADPLLTLDPHAGGPAGAGLNTLVAYIADGGAAVLPLHAEIAYSPLYLWPR